MELSDYHKMIKQARARKARMIAMRQSGKTLTEIATKYGCSKQRVHQILGRVPA